MDRNGLENEDTPGLEISEYKARPENYLNIPKYSNLHKTIKVNHSFSMDLGINGKLDKLRLYTRDLANTPLERVDVYQVLFIWNSPVEDLISLYLNVCE